MNVTHMKRPLIFGAICMMVFAVGTSILSRQFVYGVGHEDRPIVAVLLLYAVAWIGFAVATVSVWRSQHPSQRLVIWILALGMGARLIMLSSSLIQENDCYRYVLDGEAVLHGVNPFRYAPEDVAEHSTGRFKAAFEREDAQLILSRIGYPDIPTIYPPVAQMAFAAGAVLTPWRWHGQRVVFVVADILAMVLLAMALGRMGLPGGWIIFYAWNPLVIKEIANSAHLESLLSLALAGLLLSCVRWQSRPTPSRLVWIAVSLSAAILTKLYPLMLAPIVAAFVWRVCRSVKQVLALGLMCVAIGCMSYLPFMTVGVERLTEGLRTFSGTWVRNAGLYGVLDAVTPHARTFVAIIVVCVAFAAAWHVVRSADPLKALLSAMQWTLLAWFMTLPMVFPWYALGLLVICTCQPRLWALILSGMFGVYYMIFYIDYNELPAQCHTLIQTLEHAVVIGAFGVEALIVSRRGGNLFRGARKAERLDPPLGQSWEQIP